MRNDEEAQSSSATTATDELAVERWRTRPRVRATGGKEKTDREGTNRPGTTPTNVGPNPRNRAAGPSYRYTSLSDTILMTLARNSVKLQPSASAFCIFLRKIISFYERRRWRGKRTNLSM
jgi:hypothetical protein